MPWPSTDAEVTTPPLALSSSYHVFHPVKRSLPFPPLRPSSICNLKTYLRPGSDSRQLHRLLDILNLPPQVDVLKVDLLG